MKSTAQGKLLDKRVWLVTLKGAALSAIKRRRKVKTAATVHPEGRWNDENLLLRRETGTETGIMKTKLNTNLGGTKKNVQHYAARK